MQLKMQELGISVSHDAKISVVLNGSLSNLDLMITWEHLHYLNMWFTTMLEIQLKMEPVIYSFRASGGAEDANGRRLTFKRIRSWYSD